VIDGIAQGISLHIYGRKGNAFEYHFLKQGDIGENETFYIGDSDDDEPVASLLPREHFIVPFFASDEVKQRFATQHGAFVPESEDDLESFLLKK